MGFGEDEESVAQPTSSTSALSFTIITTSTRALPLLLAPSSESEQDCFGWGRELSWRRTPTGEEGFIHIAVLEHLQYGGRHRWAHPLHSELQPERGCVYEWRYLHRVHVLHVHRHCSHAGDPAPEPRGSGRRQPLYQHQVLWCVDGGRRDSEVVPELEDTTDGLGGMGQHPTPLRPERYEDGIPLTRPASGMGREWGRGGPAQTHVVANPSLWIQMNQVSILPKKGKKKSLSSWSIYGLSSNG